MTRRLAGSVAALVLTALASGASAELPRSTDTGWHTWRVAAVEGAASWCCGHWSAGKATTSTCNLARRQARIVDVGHVTAPTELQIYVHFGNSRLLGKFDRSASWARRRSWQSQHMTDKLRSGP